LLRVLFDDEPFEPVTKAAVVTSSLIWSPNNSQPPAEPDILAQFRRKLMELEMQAKVAPFLAQYRTCTWAVLAFAIGGLGSVALADTTNLPFPEAVLADSDGQLAVTIGPGGPDVEFGLSEANARIYRIALDGSTTVTVEIDALKLVNPTGIVALGAKVFLTDGATVLA
jgi:hypothetical protein